jgi:pyruvate/2-oxoglutarate dehydrogenase complex dihydrolipoamide acyltransferase (E2) component
VPIELQMPKVGLTMTEGKVVEWRKRPGDRVEKGEVVFVFETEKTTYDVEAPEAGSLARIVVEEGETVPVGAVVGLLGESGAPAAAASPAAAPPATRGEGGAPRASGASAPAGDRLVRLTGMRRTIAERMVASRREAAQAEMTVTVDATALLAAKEALAPGVERETGARLGVTDLFLAVTAAAVASHPEINTRWTDEGVLYLDAVHVGLATAVEDGLVVPVIRDVGQRRLAEVARERARLVEGARSGKLGPDDMKGSTLTVSSLGMFGVEEFTAILNPPETAILAIGAILERPAVVDRQVVVRPLVKVTLSYDHRVVDGAGAARFLASFRERAESEAALLALAGTGERAR